MWPGCQQQWEMRLGWGQTMEVRQLDQRQWGDIKRLEAEEGVLANL